MWTTWALLSDRVSLVETIGSRLGCGGGVLRLTLELSSVSIHFCRGLAESDSASQSEKKSGGRQVFEHLPILSRLRRLRGLHAAAGGHGFFSMAISLFHE